MLPINGNIAIVDFREEERIHAGSRFTVYALYPECNISISLLPNADKSSVTISVGKSIINRTSNVDIGAILLEYDGGGHAAAGTCHASNDHANRIVKELTEKFLEAD